MEKISPENIIEREKHDLRNRESFLAGIYNLHGSLCHLYN